MSRLTKIITIALLICAPLPLFALSADQIIGEMDRRSTFASSHATGTIIVTDRFGERVSTFEAWSKGSDKSLIEFTSLAERGQKILRVAQNLYLYYPEADQLIRLQGAALRQSVLGSDLSYEDMTKEKSTLDAYKATVEGTQDIDGFACYRITLTAKSRKEAYPIQHLWIDIQDFVVRKAIYATETGRELKEMQLLSTMKVGDMLVAQESKLTDLLKRNSHTTMRVEQLEINLDLADSLFSLENLSW